jgi:hypothetical protein
MHTGNHLTAYVPVLCLLCGISIEELIPKYLPVGVVRVTLVSSAGQSVGVIRFIGSLSVDSRNTRSRKTT